MGIVLSSRGPIVGIGNSLTIAGRSLPTLILRSGMLFLWQLPLTAAGLLLGVSVTMEAFVVIGVTAAWTVLCDGNRKPLEDDAAGAVGMLPVPTDSPCWRLRNREVDKARASTEDPG